MAGVRMDVDRTAADTLPGGSTGLLQNLAIQTALDPIRNDLANLQRQVNDQGRQTSKDEIVFEGTAVRLEENETERQLLQRLVKTHWGLDLKGFEDNHVDEIKQVHWLPSQNQERKRLLGKFLNLSRGSNFHKILHTTSIAGTTKSSKANKEVDHRPSTKAEHPYLHHSHDDGKMQAERKDH